MRSAFACILVVWLLTEVARGGGVEKLGSVEFKGDIVKSKNVSAVGVVGDFLVIGSDEGNIVQVLRRDGERYKLVGNVAVGESGQEVDVEGIACDGNRVYVMGSHSSKRAKVDPEADRAENRARIATHSREPGRDRVVRFVLDSEGRPSAVESTSLGPLIDVDVVLKLFRDVPSKENGVDIEGVATDGTHLYAGFRGPVLRENFTPVLKFRFGPPATAAGLLFVDLGGLGIRDLARVKDGFLILAGPVGDGPGGYHLFSWDGRDGLPGRRSSGEAGVIRKLGEIKPEADSKAEGLTLLKETNSAYEVLVVFDGLKDGGAARFRVDKP